MRRPPTTQLVTIMADPVARAPEVLSSVAAFRAACDRVRADGGTLGLVPTMGALHAGHVALITEARRRASVVAVTLFVNPTQFGPNEDFARYPRDLAADRAVCAAAGAALLFAPPVAEMYPPGERTRVVVAALTEPLCGASRPGHFDGVTTIVAKLLAVAGPCVAVFGRKDYQQLQVVRRMIRDLMLPIELVGHPTVREADGLALSSRNAYLSPDERRRALAIPRALGLAVREFEAGERRTGVLVGLVRSELVAAGLVVDYVTIADAEDLGVFGESALVPERALLALAARVGQTRLIDNVVFSEDPAPPRAGPGSE